MSNQPQAHVADMALPSIPEPRHTAKDFEPWAGVYSAHEVESLRNAAYAIGRGAAVSDYVTLRTASTQGADVAVLRYALENIANYRSDVEHNIASRSMRFYAEQALDAFQSRAAGAPAETQKLVNGEEVLKAEIVRLEKEIARAKRENKMLLDQADRILEQSERARAAQPSPATEAQGQAGATDAKEFAEAIVRNHSRLPEWIQRDHACAECVPNGEIVKLGFQCAFHRAKSYLAMLAPANSEKP